MEKISQFASSKDIQYSETGDLVYFKINTMELFGVKNTSKDVSEALNYAFNRSKDPIPVATGLMKRSYTMDRLSDTTVIIYFDPKKIVGKKRLGKIVKTYYPQYLIEYAKRFTWLQIIIKTFYTVLATQLRRLKELNDKYNSKINKLDISDKQKQRKYKESISFDGYDAFMIGFMAAYIQKKKEEIILRKLEKEKREQIEQNRKTKISELKKFEED